MKKFLTVLLVIAVMFTFSFGSALAAAPADADKVAPEKVEKEITDAAQAMKDAVTKAKTDALYGIFGSATEKEIGATNKLDVQKATVDAVYDDVLYDAAIAAIDKALALRLQDVHKAMNPTAANTKFSGYFSADSGKTSETNAAGVTITYPTYNTTFSVEVKYDVDGNGTIADSEKVTVAINAAGTVTNGANEDAFKAIFLSESSAYAADVAVEEFKAVKEDTLKAIRAIDLNAYSKEYKGEPKSNYDLASDLVNAAIDAVAAINLDEDPTWNEIAGASGLVANVKGIYKAGKNQGLPSGRLADATPTGLLAAPYNEVGLNNLTTIADEPTEEAKLEWAKSKTLAKMNDEIDARLSSILKAQDNIILEETLKGAKGDATVIAKAKEAKEDAQEEAAAAKEIVAYLVGDATKVDELLAAGTPFSAREVKYANAEGSWYYAADGGLRAVGIKTDLNGGYNYFTAAQQVKIVKHVAELKEEAEILKASVMIDGAEYVAIEKALEKAIDTCYKTGTLTNRVARTDAQGALWNRQDELLTTGTAGMVKIGDRKYPVMNNWVAPLNDAKDTNNNGIDDDTPAFDGHNGVYEQELYDEIRTVLDETETAILASKTIEEADAAFLAGLDKFDKILTRADRTTVQLTKEFSDLQTKYQKELRAYIDYKIDVMDKTKTAKDYSWDADGSTLYDKLAAKMADAYSVEELKTAYEAAKAEVDGLKTKAELDATKKALEDRIAALPKTITVADKEVVGALRSEIADHNDYCDLIGNTLQVVTKNVAVDNAYEKIRELEENAIKDAIKAIGTVTVEDEAAIKEAKAMLDAYVAYYAGEDATDKRIELLKGVNYSGTTVAKLQSDLNAAKEKAFYVMVGKLPADGSDVAGIKAARAAYEDLARANKRTAYRSAEYDKLLDLEKILAETVKSLKITASSKATKGAITVKWTVKGNKAAADGYQVWKSTKMNSGYKKAFTTTKTTYKNTKGLKKGVKYYYKVRAYKVVDGKNVYSDWSNKAYRAAK